MKKYLYSLALLFLGGGLFAQVGINHDGSDPADGTILHVKSQAATKPDVVVSDNTGYVGIGTTDPQDRLDVWGGFRMSLDGNNYVRFFGAPTQIAGHNVMEGLVQIAGVAIQRYAFLVPNANGGLDTLVTLFPPTGGIGIGTNTPFPGNILQINATNDTLKGYVVVKKENGYVGIGTPNPQNRLDIWGTVRLSVTPADYMLITARPMVIGDQTAAEAVAQLEGNAIQRYAFVANNGNGYDTLVSIFRPTGGIGIGTNLPQGKIHVHLTDNDLDLGIGSIGMEYNGFDTWQGMAVVKDPNTSLIFPMLAYGPETKPFTITQFTGDNRSLPSETRMTFMPTGATGIGDPSTHNKPDAALTVSNGPMIHLSGVHGDLLKLLDDNTERIVVDANGNVTFPNGGSITVPEFTTSGDATINGDLYLNNLSVVGDAEIAGTTTLEDDLSGKNALFDGDLSVTGTIGTDGNIEMSGNTHLTRTDQGSADLLPYAYAVVAANGDTSGDTENLLVIHDANTNVYTITFNDDYNPSDFVVLITPQNDSPVMAVTGQDGTDLVVKLYDTDGNGVESAFQILVYKK